MKQITLGLSLFFTGLIFDIYLRKLNRTIEHRMFYDKPLSTGQLIRISNICCALSGRFFKQSQEFETNVKELSNK